MPGDEGRALSRLACERPRVSGLLAGLLFGLMMALSFPPVWMWGLVFVAPLPLVWLCWFGRGRPLTAAFWCAVGVSPWWALAHVWVGGVSAFGLVPLVIALSGCTMVAVWGAALAHRCAGWTLVLWPVVWVGAEFFRGSILANGYAWYLLGHPLAGERWLAWPAALVGTYGVSLLAAVPATALVAWMAGRRRAGVSLGAVVVAWGVGGLVVDPWPGGEGSLRVAVVQTNVPQSNKIDWSLEQRAEDWGAMRRLIVSASELEPDVIVLPEAMSPGWTLGSESLEHERGMGLYFELTGRGGVPERHEVTEFADELIIVQEAVGIPIIIGGPGYERLEIRRDEEDRYWYDAAARYNSVFVVEGGRAPTERYDKVALTPFGEYMPYISWWPWLERRLLGFGASGMRFDLDAGREYRALRVRLRDGREVRLATPVCFEATMPGVCRRLVGPSGSAEAMVNLTNDGWFGGWMPGREHHMLTARWRCLELGVSMIRAANTGISCGFDGAGRLIGEGVDDPRTGRRVLGLGEGVRVMEIPTGGGRTVYARVGEVSGLGFPLVQGGVVLVCGVGGRSIGRGKQGAGEPGRGERRSRSGGVVERAERC